MKVSRAVAGIKNLKPKKKVESKLGLSSGSTLANLCATDGRSTDLFYTPGHYYYFVGDSGSGKTWLAISCLAEAANDPRFDKYELIFDNGEDGALMDLTHYFGKKLAARIRPPKMVKGHPVFSSTIKGLAYNIDTVAKSGKPFIYVQDSFDVLEDDSEIELFDNNKKASEDGKTEGKSYGTQKARTISTMFRRILRNIRDTNSILIIISQTRDKVGALPFQKQKTRSGGRSLTFYATTEIWTSSVGKITKTFRGKNRYIGTYIKMEMEKNRESGEKSPITIPILKKTGVDDTGSMVDFLVEEKCWKINKGKIATQYGVFDRERLVQYIESNGKESQVKSLCQRTWNEIQAAVNPIRKKRYE